MMTRLQDIEDIQGAMIRRLLQGKAIAPIVGPLTPELVAKAHAMFLEGRPGGPVPHQSSASVVMFIAKGKWKGLCPECRCGVSTGAGWTEARCFECGAILAPVWPADREALAARLLARPPVEQWWHPEQEE